eukprot:scaffold155332_cov34-Tisochrysis_lutea.AAC.4
MMVRPPRAAGTLLIYRLFFVHPGSSCWVRHSRSLLTTSSGNYGTRATTGRPFSSACARQSAQPRTTTRMAVAAAAAANDDGVPSGYSVHGRRVGGAVVWCSGTGLAWACRQGVHACS